MSDDLEDILKEGAQKLQRLTQGVPDSSFFSNNKEVVKRKMHPVAKGFLTLAIIVSSIAGCATYIERKEIKEYKERMAEEERKLAVENAKTVYTIDARPHVGYIEFTENKAHWEELRQYFHQFYDLDKTDIDYYAIKKGDLKGSISCYEKDPFVFWVKPTDKERACYVTKVRFIPAFRKIFPKRQQTATRKHNLPDDALCLDGKIKNGNYSLDTQWKY